MAYLEFPFGCANPKDHLTNSDIAKLFPEWDSSSILNKVGIESRRICGSNESSLDLAIEAFKNLREGSDNNEFDFLIYISNSSRNQAPGDGHLFLNKVCESRNIGCLDVNLGCSGFTYGLGLAASLINSKSCKRILLITTDAYSKFISKDDKSNLTLFGDGAVASFVSDVVYSNSAWEIKNFMFGSNGNGFHDLNISCSAQMENLKLYMDGKSIFNFASNEVVDFVRKQNIDFSRFTAVFHQANSFMLDYMRKKLGIREEKFVIAMRNRGNTVSASIPYAINDSPLALYRKDLFLLGFGIGASYSSVCLYSLKTDISDCI